MAFALWRFSPQLAAIVGIENPIGSAPDVGWVTLDGEEVRLADLRGKVVLVNFWATWCAPCRLEMPGFEKLYRAKKDDGFVLVGLSTDQTGRAGVEAFLRERDITYPVAMATRELDLAFGGISAIPTSFLIDRQGVIRHRTFGIFPATGVRFAVNRLLAESEIVDPPLDDGAGR
jgi:cytochrome c biogenesis protein CcmG, thiol:disulfide interchange protein DsbE